MLINYVQLNIYFLYVYAVKMFAEYYKRRDANRVKRVDFIVVFFF